MRRWVLLKERQTCGFCNGDQAVGQPMLEIELAPRIVKWRCPSCADEAVPAVIGDVPTPPLKMRANADGLVHVRGAASAFVRTLTRVK